MHTLSETHNDGVKFKDLCFNILSLKGHTPQEAM